MQLQINSTLQLELLDTKHSEALYQLALSNKDYLSPWMPWVEKMDNLEFIENFIASSKQKYREGTELAFVILLDKKMVGRIGIYSINKVNKVGELGYWIAKAHQGRGIIIVSCKKLISLAFEQLELNRIEIKCGTTNYKSQRIPEILAFKKEALLRAAELIRNQAHDLILYSLLKRECAYSNSL